MDKYQKIDRIFDGIKKINKEALEKFEKELGREITFEEYCEKYIEDVTAGFLTGFVEGYPKGKDDGVKASKKSKWKVLKNKN